MADPYNILPNAHSDPESFSKLHTDEAILKCFPQGATIISITNHGASLWTQSAKLDVKLIDGKVQSYFIKLSTAPAILYGSYASAQSMSHITPSLTPTPLALGICTSPPHRTFFLQSFHPIFPLLHTNNLPGLLASFHKKSIVAYRHLTPSRPAGMRFGYHCTTHNATLAQDNTWTDSWEEYFTRNMRVMLGYDECAGGKRDGECEELIRGLFENVVPRLLGVMERGGRGKGVRPCLLHGDMWEGNVGVNGEGDGDVLVFDACCFWGHNEYDLRTLRSPTNPAFGIRERDAYLERYPPAWPEEDFEARNDLYYLRSILHDCALFPQNPQHRQRFKEEVRKLVDMFPEGLEGWLMQREAKESTWSSQKKDDQNGEAADAQKHSQML